MSSPRHGGDGGSSLAAGRDPYIRLKQLGQGSFGRVLLVRDSRDGQLYVLKEVRHQRERGDWGDSADLRFIRTASLTSPHSHSPLSQVDLQQFGAKGKKEALKEVAFLSQLSHPCIIQYKEFYEKAGGGGGGGGPNQQANANGAPMDAKFDSGNKPMMFIVMEHANGGDLDAKIKAQRKMGVPFTERQVVDYLVQILLAMKHIHDRKILHRDIKSENIFLTSDPAHPGTPMCKLGDFGISKHLSSTMAQAQTRIGTPYYLSPEICMNKPYNQKSDVSRRRRGEGRTKWYEQAGLCCELPTHF